MSTRNLSRSAAIALLVILCMATLGFASVPVAAAAGPFLGVTPNPATESQVTAQGSEFCASHGCSAVTIVIEGEVVASGIQVGPDGAFEAVINVPEVAGDYVVTASQTNAQGATVSAQAPLTVMAIDNIGPTATPNPTPGGNQPTLTPVADGPPPSPPSATPPAQTPSSPTPENQASDATPTITPSPDEDLDSGDGGTSPWLIVAIVGLGVAALAAAALVVVWLRRRAS